MTAEEFWHPEGPLVPRAVTVGVPMPSKEMMLTISATEIPEVRALIAAVQKLIAARAGGVDTYEADNEIDDIERALARVGGYYEKVCSECGEPFAPRHSWHLRDITWIDPGAFLRLERR